jgi:dTDP-4-dehydrorhamnose 3,5-epimerase
VRFHETTLQGAFLVELERRADDRGYFARAFCRDEFSAHGLNPNIAQVNVGRNTLKGTVRGVHFQFPPVAEAKLVRAVRGALFDVGVDLRPESPTFLQHVAVELTADDGRALYLPERFGHAYQALEDGTDMLYLASVPYTPGSDGGLSPLDPRLGISWPLPVTAMSPKDAGATGLDDLLEGLTRRMTV